MISSPGRRGVAASRRKHSLHGHLELKEMSLRSLVEGLRPRSPKCEKGTETLSLASLADPGGGVGIQCLVLACCAVGPEGRVLIPLPHHS